MIRFVPRPLLITAALLASVAACKPRPVADPVVRDAGSAGNAGIAPPPGSSKAATATEAAAGAAGSGGAQNAAFTAADVPDGDDELPCTREFANQDALCACLGGVIAGQDKNEPGTAFTCKATQKLSADGRLVLLEVAIDGGITERFLTTLTPGDTMVLARAGRASVGNHRLGLGVKGIYESKLAPIEEKLGHTPPLVIVRWSVQTNVPTEGPSMAEITGWEERIESWTAYCVPTGPHAPRCNVVALTELSIQQSSGGGSGKPTVKKSVTKTRTTFDKEGGITLTVVKGKEADLPRDSVGGFQL